MTYGREVTGPRAVFEPRRESSSEIVQGKLDRSTIVKSLNHIGYHELAEDRRPAGSPERRALGVAGGDRGAGDVGARPIDRIGYDAVPPGSLTAGRPPVTGRPALHV